MKPYYQDEWVTIYHGRWQDIPFPLFFSLVLTDPPYGIKRDKGFTGHGGFGKPIARRKYDNNWDGDRPSGEDLRKLAAMGENAIIWGGNFFADLLPRSTHWIFWDKMQTMPSFSDGELAWTNIKRKSVAKVTIQWNGLLGRESGRFHPTQKPLKLMEWCIDRYSAKGDLIFDAYAGSGTTGRAAKNLGRHCIMVEMEEKDCEIAAKRCAQEVLEF